MKRVIDMGFKKEKKAPTFKCQKCGSENPVDAKFCLSCGSGLQEQKKVQSKVAEATQITEDFKDKGGFWAKIIPGYHGYKKKEIRRESDKLLRDHLVKQLSIVKNDLSSIEEEAASSAPGILKKLEDMLTELDTFSRKIQHANYGFGEMFGTDKVQEPELDKLIEFDRSVVETIISLQKGIKELGAHLDEDSDDKVKEIRGFIKDATSYYAQREDFIQGWTPE
jgi:hypothetical protein